MIDPRELRIGNWIDEQGLELQVGIVRMDYFPSTQPIKLNEAWLLKFGFESQQNIHKESYYILIKDGMVLGICDNGRHWICPHISTSIKISYVHQLQNLYFALTGSELTIKDNDSKGQKETEA